MTRTALKQDSRLIEPQGPGQYDGVTGDAEVQRQRIYEPVGARHPVAGSSARLHVAGRAVDRRVDR